jgi:hypothetical protein
VTYDVVVTVDNPELLLFPGMTADAEIVTDSREDVLRVPLAATRFMPEGVHMSDFPRAGGDGGKRKHEGDEAASASSSASTSASASAASSSASASAPQQAQGERRHRDDGQGGQGNGAHRWRSDDASAADDPQRAERRRAWLRDHPDFAGRGDGSGHGWRHRQDDQQAADKKADDKSDDTKDDGKDTKAVAKSDKSGKSDESDDKPADMNDTLATTAPPAPPPRKRARVWVMRDGKPVPVSIVIGLDDGDTVEVLEGDLKPGDKVIVNEVRPVETIAAHGTAMPSPFGQGGGMRGPGAGGGRR